MAEGPSERARWKSSVQSTQACEWGRAAVLLRVLLPYPENAPYRTPGYLAVVALRFADLRSAHEQCLRPRTCPVWSACACDNACACVGFLFVKACTYVHVPAVQARTTALDLRAFESTVAPNCNRKWSRGLL